MFDRLADLADGELEAAVREAELERRRVEVRLAELVGEADRRRVYAVDGHATVAGWLRTINRWSSAECARFRRVGRLLHQEEVIAAAARAGSIGVGQLQVLARVRANPRCGDRLGEFAGIFVEHAQALSFDDFELCAKRWELIADADGAHRSAEHVDAQRTAGVFGIDGTFIIRGIGGAVQGAEMEQIFNRYVEDEFRQEWARTLAVHGDAAVPALMERTDAQRRFDALHRIFLDAVSTPAGCQPPEPLVHVVIDVETFRDALERMFGPEAAGRMLDLPTRRQRRARDPRRWRCETREGILLDPAQVVAAALVGRIRRVVFDSAGVVVNMGRQRRLFTGNARDAALLSSVRCVWPGCTLASGRCHTDHNRDWGHGGPSDQDNAGPLCRRHNHWKNRGYTVQRDATGLWHTHRPDGTEVA